ncbi:MAG: beta-galactosidase, partial [Sphingomonas sp.]
LKTGTSTGPGGTLAINNRYITRDGRPWIPVMGEFHFSRYPAAEWEDELLKMKASGVEVVSSYVIWNQLELAPGKLDWTDNRDIRRFVQLCAKHGLLFFARPGPFVHGETRFGGIPDWVIARTRYRTDDPLYMAEVARFWGELGQQLQGLMWKDGGPIIGVQLENEYVQTGEGRGAGHIAALKALAVKSGMDVPLYTVTGWGRASYPRREVAPVVGAYPDEPWSTSTTKLPPHESFMFRFKSRVEGTLGAQAVGAGSGPADIDKDMPYTPFLGAEYGPGVTLMYRRRPIIATADVGATVTTQLGSGLNMLGYYMYHGGANPLVAGRTLEETTRSGSYSDVQIISYDYQSPLGIYGEVTPVSATIRPLHAFLAAFGERLAPMTVRVPAVVPSATGDLVTPRFAVRSAGDSGFLFVNNHVRQYEMAAQKGVQFDVALPGRTLRFPSKPVDIAPDDYFIWPFHFDMDGIRLSWASAQPVTRLQDAEGPIYVFKTTGDIAPEFAFDAGGIERLSAPARRDGDRLIVDAFRPSARRLLTVRGKNGRTARILLLSDADAKRAWIGDIAGTRRMVLTDAALFTSGDTLVLRQRDRTAFRFAIWPALAGLKGSAPLRSVRDGSLAYEVRLPAAAPL